METYINTGNSVIDEMLDALVSRRPELSGLLCILSENSEMSHRCPYVIVVYESDTYTSSEKHRRLSDEYGSSYIYIKLPISVPELELRLTSLMPKGKGSDTSEPFRYSKANLTVYGDGTSVSLSPKEAELFELLLTSRGTPVSREKMRSLIWSSTDGTNAPDVYVSYLRRKLSAVMGDGAIVNVRGKGYMLKY